MAIYEIDGQGPDFPADGNYFIAETATIIGKVRLKANASVWFGAVLPLRVETLRAAPDKRE